MIISLRQKFIYVSNLKVASTSVLDALKLYADVRIAQSEFGKHLSLRGILKRFNWIFDYIPREEFFIFSTIRNPLEYLVSLYYSHKADKFKNNPNLYTGEMDFPEFIDTWVSKNKGQTIPQSERFLNERNEFELNYLIDFSKVNEQFLEVCGHIGVNNASLGLKNESIKDSMYEDILNDSAWISYANEHYASDYKLIRNNCGRLK